MKNENILRNTNALLNASVLASIAILSFYPLQGNEGPSNDCTEMCQDLCSSFPRLSKHVSSETEDSRAVNANVQPPLFVQAKLDEWVRFCDSGDLATRESARANLWDLATQLKLYQLSTSKTPDGLIQCETLSQQATRAGKILKAAFLSANVAFREAEIVRERAAIEGEIQKLSELQGISE